MFKSFFLAGFECATGYNSGGEWIDQVVATQHDKHVEEDYRRLREVGITAVREGIRWPYVDFRGHYDFSSVTPFVKAANNHGIEVIWDLFHYGYPERLDIFSDEFRKRFVDYCHAVAHYIQSNQDGPYYFTPVNEPSYFAWAAGDMRRFAPYCEGRGIELKICLARAAIEGINAIRAVIPGARIVNVDPMCRMALPKDRPDLAEAVNKYNLSTVFGAWDMLCGKVLPELGGSRAHLDIVGMNYYWTNQWEIGQDEHPLSAEDERRVSLSELARTLWQRYGGDLLITESAHVNDMRASWLNYVADEAHKLVREGVALRGVCLYPILGMPEWHDRRQWTPMGLWDLEQRGSKLHRKIHQPMLDALRGAQKRLAQAHRRK